MIVSLIYIFEFFLSSSFFVVVCFVQFCIILVRNGMFYEKHKSSYLDTILYYVIDTVYIYSWKTIDKILTHFGDALCIFYFLFLSHVVFNLTIEWTLHDICSIITLLNLWIWIKVKGFTVKTATVKFKSRSGMQWALHSVNRFEVRDATYSLALLSPLRPFKVGRKQIM